MKRLATTFVFALALGTGCSSSPEAAIGVDTTLVTLHSDGSREVIHYVATREQVAREAAERQAALTRKQLPPVQQQPDQVSSAISTWSCADASSIWIQDTQLLHV